jgi:hypothetical protein
MPDSDLQKRLEQLGRRLVEDVERWEQSTRDQRRETLTHITEHIGQQIAKAVEKERARHQQKKESRRERRAREREERRQKQRDEASTVVGVAQLLVALAFLAFAALRPDLWWMVFVAMGLGIGGARQLSLASERKRRERAEAQPEPVIPSKVEAQAHEVDLLCDQLLADLKESPQAVQQFVQAPEKTIAALRATARALDARRRQLLAEAPADRLSALGPQEEALKTRRDGASDDVTRRRLDDALRSLAGQRAALEQLQVAAERVDGEYTSLLVSLQELRTRVAVAKTAGSAVQLEGLKGSVQRLNGELEAIGEALSSVAHEGLTPVAPISVDDEEQPRVGDRERV